VRAQHTVGIKAFARKERAVDGGKVHADFSFSQRDTPGHIYQYLWIKIVTLADFDRDYAENLSNIHTIGGVCGILSLPLLGGRRNDMGESNYGMV
jgi:hypothetical protein